MAASNEWQTKYLTSDGWKIGGYRYDDGETKEDIQPHGAVLRAYRKVTVGALGAPSSMKVDESKSDLTQDKQLIQALLSKYGEPVFSV